MLRVERLQVGSLKPLTFEVADGECLAVEGPSGAGKTLLLRALADLDAAPGRVVVDGQERREVPAYEWRRRVRYCAAEPAWWTDTPRPCLPAAPKLDRLLQSLDLGPDLLDRPVALLSTGERQRLALVRALLDEAQVLLLDEPTGALDPQSTALAEELIRFQMLSGRCVVLVSHDAAQVSRLAHARPRALEGEAGARSSRGRSAMTYVPLSYWDLVLAATLLIANGAISWAFRLGLEKSIAIAALRMVVQLALIAVVLKFIFAQASPAWTLVFALVMVVAAGVEIVARLGDRMPAWPLMGLSSSTLLFVGTFVTVFGVGVVISPHPWYAPRYVLPVLGMVLGNTMTAVALVLDSLSEAAQRQRTAIEARLALGAHRFEALSGPLRGALRTGLMPMLNSMATTGIVAIPGMMTGQIIAGADPVGAAKYQVMIMFLIAGATALGSLLAAAGGVLLLTDERHRLRLPRETAKNESARI